MIQIDNWEQHNKYLESQEFMLSFKTLDVLHIPKGYVSSIQSLEEYSKLLVMGDYFLGEINDEYKYPQRYFEKI